MVSWDAGFVEVLTCCFGLAGLTVYILIAPRRPRSLLILRGFFLALVVILIPKPTYVALRKKWDRPMISVLVDSSRWMSAESADGKTTRFESAMGWLGKHRKEIESHADVEYYFFSDHASKFAWDDIGDTSHFLQKMESVPNFRGDQLVLERVLRETSSPGKKPPSQVWLLTDGVGESSGGLDSVLARAPSPVYTIGVGRRSVAGGVWIRSIRRPDFVFLHEPFNVQYDWEAGELKGCTLVMRLTRGAAGRAVSGTSVLRRRNSRYRSEDSSVLAERSVHIRSDFESGTSTFTVIPAGLGEERYTLEILPRGGIKGGVVRQPFRVEVIRQKLRIMYLCGVPSFEYSALRHFLKSDLNNELVSFVILRNPEDVAPVSDHELSLIPFPAHEIFVQTISEFDVFILHNFALWRFRIPASYLERVKHFVGEGGGLLVIGGSQGFARGGYGGTALEDVLPVKMAAKQSRKGGAVGKPDYIAGPFRAQPASMDHPLARFGENEVSSKMLWSRLPLLGGFQRFASVRKGATVVAVVPEEKTVSGELNPLFATREFGKGKVMVSGTNSTWRWRLGSGTYWKTSNFYENFWRKALQYLSGSLSLKRVQFAPLPEKISRPPVSAAVHVFDDNFRPLSGRDLRVRVLWAAPKKGWKEVPAHETEPGVFNVELEDLDVGIHKLRALATYRGGALGSDETRFQWAGAGQSFQPMDEALLKKIAARTGGEYALLKNVPLKEWLARLPSAQFAEEVASRKPLWASSGWVWLLCAMMGIDWYLGRRWGLP